MLALFSPALIIFIAEVAIRETSAVQAAIVSLCYTYVVPSLYDDWLTS
jgi:hypothetical protein